MKSVSKTFCKKNVDTAIALTRSLHLGQDFPTCAKKKIPDTKVSAAVRASCLPKNDRRTEQLPVELPHPTETIAAAFSSAGPKRTEMDQRRVRLSESSSNLQGMMGKTNVCKEVTVQCVPYKKDNAKRRCYETAEEVLKNEKNPDNLAEMIVKLRKQLKAETAKNERLTRSYLEMKEEQYARHCDQARKNRAGSPSATSASPSASTSSQGKPVTGSTSCSPSQGNTDNKSK